MKLSDDLIARFARAAVKPPEKPVLNTVYGTAVNRDGTTFVQLNGSDSLTPADTTVTVQDGERVAVTIENHKATITGSLSEPAVSDDDLDNLYDMILAEQGNAIVSSTPYYKSFASATVPPDWDDSWNTTPQRVEGESLWMVTAVTYQNGKTERTTPVCISGADGVGIASVTQIYKRYTKSRPSLPASSGSVSSSSNTDSWTTAVPSVTTAYKYVWISTMVILSNGATTFTTPVLSQDLGYYANFQAKIETSLYSGTVDLGSDYVIAPNIGGGYLDITDGVNRVIIDPADVDPANAGEYLLFAQSNEETVFSIDRYGNAAFAGELKAATGSFYGTVDMRCTDFVGYDWLDVIGCRFKDDTFCVYTGTENPVHKDEESRYTIKRMLYIYPGEAASSRPQIGSDYDYVDVTCNIRLHDFLTCVSPGGITQTPIRTIGLSSANNISINPDCVGDVYIRTASDGYINFGSAANPIAGLKLNGSVVSLGGGGATKTSELTQTYTNASASGHGKGARLITFKGISSGDYTGATAEYVQNYCNNYTAAHFSELGHTHSGYAPSSHSHSGYCPYATYNASDLSSTVYQLANGNSIRVGRNLQVAAFGSSTGGGAVYTNSYGTLTKSGSSRRWKHDIADLTDDAMNPERLYDLPVKQYVYNEDWLDPIDQRYKQLVVGFIAEDVAEVYPVAADIGADGAVEDWNLRFLIPPMLKLIQMQREELEALKERIARLG